MAKIVSYKELVYWQKSIRLVTQVYKVTKSFPKSEIYGLTSQIQRSAISIPSNIAEGSQRYSRKENARFHQIAFASGAELETQLIIAKNLEYISLNDHKTIEEFLAEIMKMLNKAIRTLRYKSS